MSSFQLSDTPSTEHIPISDLEPEQVGRVVLCSEYPKMRGRLILALPDCVSFNRHDFATPDARVLLDLRTMNVFTVNTPRARDTHVEVLSDPVQVTLHP